ncbi:MAG: hypothetical protein R3C14_41565 [Caldilineaceae bacterium]
MFRKRQQKSTVKVAHPQAYTDMALTVHVVHGEVSYGFPQEIVLQLRHMVTKLERQQRLPRKLSMISALRSEGVSLTTLALATIIAHDFSRTVCVVDLNWWWPSEPMRHFSSFSSGIMPLLRGEVEWDSALVRTNFPNLAILPAGTLPIEQRPIIARNIALKGLIDTLSEQVDHLFLDVPAILTTSDAIPLASLGEACCVVVHQGISTRSVVRHALGELNHLPTLGVVMNRVKVATPSWLLQWIPQE